jgi:hypothetical protein
MRIIYALLAAICLTFCQPAIAQDKILLRNGDEMKVKILEVASDSVRFSNFSDSAKAVMQAIPKTHIFSITYQDGQRVVIPEFAQPQPETLSPGFLYAQGRSDARRFYKAGGAFWATFGTSLIIPLGGPLLAVPTGAVATLIDVPQRNIIASNPEYKRSPEYLRGYQKQAKNKKLGNAAAGLGTGTVVLFGALAYALSHY